MSHLGDNMYPLVNNTLDVDTLEIHTSPKFIFKGALKV